MAAALAALLVFLLTAAASALEPGHGHVPPHLTGCLSNNMETFNCRWSVGSFQNLSEPGDLRLFYYNRKPLTAPQENWSECPQYSMERPNECFFDQNHTTIWTTYTIQLRSRDQDVLYDETPVEVSVIVKPDPPVGLNWTLMNVSLTSAHFDIMLSWKPPRSADVETGWLTLLYEVQYRDVDSDEWKVMNLVKSPHRSVFGLQTNVHHEVRVRCKMLGGKLFGEFSDSVFVHISSKVSRFPVVALLMFGVFCLVAVLMFVVILQQEKLMFILLPPVPGPKIRGIDPDLLKKGKLRELTSILGGPPDLRPELYNSDPWVEFIDLDIEDQNEKLTDLDTNCLMDHSLSTNYSPLSGGFRDDDSGRSSCCEPDLLSESNSSPIHPFTQNQTLLKEAPYQKASDLGFGVQSSTRVDPSLVSPCREAVYTMVCEVRSSGNVLLSPEEQTEVEENTHKEIVMEKEEEPKQVQLLLMSSDHRELSKRTLQDPFQSGVNPNPTHYPSPNQDSSTIPQSPLTPAPVYTVVEGVDGQNSLLLTPNSSPTPHLIIPKAGPTPDGYLTPDQLGSITP
ncbi:growth hormone receptor b isoform X2 [Nothobranchius furzeri]|nr:transcript variant X1 [Nothobranchius furzeri]